MFKKLTVLTQTYHQEHLTRILVSSFEEHKPDGLEIEYVVVEGSDDTSYKDKVTSISENVKWYNNTGGEVNDPVTGASTANALNLEYGKTKVSSEWVFVCHNDVAVQSENFFHVLFEHSKKYDLISCCKDNNRIEACHISGLLVKNEILQITDCMHKLPGIDVGDNLTVYCRENDLPYTSLPNTHNDPSLWDDLSGTWKEVGKNCGIDRCIVNNEVIFCHLGRGTPKSLNRYTKSGKITYGGWCKLHEKYLGND